ncbi:MAG: CubicO group peptidase (beta-lactamase class C family) [Rhodothermales bacterium]|jgi:CubicO group peptidase (beta-lactamase class C family)
MPLAAYARERLFDPTGMQTTHLMVDEYYNTVTIGGMRTRLREFARVAQLMANVGKWNGAQIVPAQWVRDSVTPGEKNAYYGYLWWIDQEMGAYSAAGTFDQTILVLPEQDLVAVRLQRDVESGRNGHYWNRETPVVLRGIVEF